MSEQTSRPQETGNAIPDTARQIFREAEMAGGRVANRIRYVFAFLLLLVVIGVGKSAGGLDQVVNYSVWAIYLLLTVSQTLALRRGSARINGVFTYFSTAFDFTLITLVLAYYTARYNPDNWSFAGKNPVLLFYVLPLLLTALQFRIRLLIFATVLCLLLIGAVILGTFLQDVPWTTDWSRYVMGPEIVAGDYAVSRPIVFLSIGLVLGYAILRSRSMVRRMGAVEAQKASLSRYFAPQIAERISAGSDELTRGRRVRATILFSDIRNFTAMSESMAPDELADFLSEFRERMSRAIFANGGMLDKFVGDAIMAAFGAPEPSEAAGADERNAVRAARAMLLELEEFNRERHARGESTIAVGIGLHAGEVFAGNVGRGGRLEYTLLGDAVNTASRIESLCKKMGAALLLSEAVYECLDQAEQDGAERMPRVLVKGKELPLQTYRLARLLEGAAPRDEATERP